MTYHMQDMKDLAPPDNRTYYEQGRSDQRLGDLAVLVVCLIVAGIYIVWSN